MVKFCSDCEWREAREITVERAGLRCGQGGQPLRGGEDAASQLARQQAKAALTNNIYKQEVPQGRIA